MNRIPKTLLITAALAAFPGFAFANDHKKPPGALVSWKEVPPAVQTTIQTNAAGGKVVEVNKQTGNTGLFYLAEVKGTDRKWTKVYVSDTGTLMKVEPDNARNKRKHKPIFGSNLPAAPGAHIDEPMTGLEPVTC